MANVERVTNIIWVTVVLAFFSGLCTVASQTINTRQDGSAGVLTPVAEQKVENLVSRMTLDEKIDLLSGTGFETKPIARLGIPALNMTDGPVGVRWDQSTTFPASIAMAATWDPALIEQVGAALGREVKGKGRHMLLGPCVNINRVPQGGRSFESFGEDPYLASRMTVAYVKGVQAEKVVACTKHYACNNQEWQRDVIDVKVDERALREIYLPAFRAAVQEAGSWAIMSAYNKVNGSYCSENEFLLTDILKKEWGFKGLVVSDWGAVHSTIPTANAGLDLEMPDGRYLNTSLRDAVKKGEVKESVINEKIRRVLRVIEWAGLLEGVGKKDSGVVDSKAHRELALNVARQSIVLLKNDNAILPLDLEKVKSIAVIGPNAAVARTGGGGSSMVKPFYAVSPLEGLRNKVAEKVTVRYAAGCLMEGDVIPIESSALSPPGETTQGHGLKGEYFPNKNLAGKPVLTRIDRQIDFDWGDGSPAPEIPKDGFSARWTGGLTPPSSDTYELSVRSDDGVRLFIDNELFIDNWNDHASETKTRSLAMLAGRTYEIRLEYYENEGGANMQFGWSVVSAKFSDEAIATARKSEVALVFVGLSANFESEGFDRQTLELPSSQIDLIEAVTRANPNTVVVLNTGAPVLMQKWLDKVPAVVQTWYAGQEGGNAIADVLVGDVNPSGKLPVTFLKEWKDSPAHDTYPGSNGTTSYAEGIFVGYCHFDKANIEPLFPFGYGLSYSTFEHSNLRIVPGGSSRGSTTEVSVDIRNSSRRDGAEVAQLYVHDSHSVVPRPVKELKAFQKVFLKAGETKKVTFTLDESSFAFFDPARREWRVEPGRFEVLIGSSSRNIRLSRGIDILK
jgi:beta-glucosidase